MDEFYGARFPSVGKGVRERHQARCEMSNDEKFDLIEREGACMLAAAAKARDRKTREEIATLLDVPDNAIMKGLDCVEDALGIRRE